MVDDDDAWRRLADNPFSYRLEAYVKEDIALFHKNKLLEEVISFEQFRKGAMIARHDSYQGAVGLTPAEQQALENERNPSFWRQTQDLKVTILTTACAAIVQGWQQSSINATSDSWQQSFPYNSPDGKTCGWDEHRYLAGFVNAAPWISASIIGTWLTDPLQEGGLGRRPALFVSAIFCIGCVLGKIGAKASIAPVLAAEVADTRIRGRILVLWQVFDALGIFLGFACVWIVDQSWRVVLGAPAIPAIVLLFLVFLCPESPRFLIRTKKYKKAYLSLRRLKETEVQAARDLYDIHIRLQWEARILDKRDPIEEVDDVFRGDKVPKPSFKLFPRRIVELWTKPRNRRACIAACLAMLAQQMCGINAIAFYSNTLFGDSEGCKMTPPQNATTSNTGVTSKMANLVPRNATTNGTLIENSDVDWMNFGFGLSNFVFSLPVYTRIDQVGRRVLLLYSLGGMFFTLLPLAVGIFELAPHYGDGGFKAMVAILGVVAFTACYGVGAGPVPFTLSAEAFPLAVREVGMSFCVMVNFIGLSLIILLLPEVTQILQDREGTAPKWRGNAILLFYFMGFNALAFVLVFFLVPDGTQKHGLESMNEIFGNSMMSRLKKEYLGRDDGSAQEIQLQNTNGGEVH
ncbi:MFS transporter [Aspergillus brunneoviolaceus CBS 621.78]|uniref:MFS transporter n=1 Tax=Aspergillus brunneoviolaceus CBS 621.78 TaxID=1450534 RepID=A0ACD1FY24_9EURO|nr:MFS transporter [Aspergillus brunneoviolaceus CBS 621.78]RAH41869.1 MFS transporter [Aspergillus brunneoviolaceus CBS 621.78]